MPSDSLEVTSINLCLLRIAVFESLRESEEVLTITINNLRRDCEARLNLPEHSLDGSNYKRILASNFTEYLSIREASTKNKPTSDESEVSTAEKEKIVADFVFQNYIEYTSSNQTSEAGKKANNAGLHENTVWAGISRLVPQLSPKEIEEIVNVKLQKVKLDLHGHGINTSSSRNSEIRGAFNEGEEILRSGDPEVFNISEALVPPCKAMKSSFSTIKWLESIERCGASDESEIIWSDIDEELSLSASFSALRWNDVVKSMPSKLSLAKKLERLHAIHSANGDSRDAPHSQTPTRKHPITKKRSNDGDVEGSVTKLSVIERTVVTDSGGGDLSKHNTVDHATDTSRCHIASLNNADRHSAEFGSPLDTSHCSGDSNPTTVRPVAYGVHRIHDKQKNCVSHNTNLPQDGALGNSAKMVQATNLTTIVAETSEELRLSKKKRKLLRNEKRLRKIIKTLSREESAARLTQLE